MHRRKESLLKKERKWGTNLTTREKKRNYVEKREEIEEQKQKTQAGIAHRQRNWVALDDKAEVAGCWRVSRCHCTACQPLARPAPLPMIYNT